MRNKLACAGFFVLVLLVITIGIGMGYLYHVAQTLPDINFMREYNPGQITRIYANNREEMASFCLEKRIIVPLDEIHPNFIKAVLSSEDVNFYQHHGIYWPRVIQATWRNLMAGRFVEGASTITQQLTRLVFLYPQKTISRKIREIILTMEIEKKYSKRTILELYLNHIYFGHSAYGVESAAETYFGKKASELNLPEAALLAGLIRAPSKYSPFCNEDLAKKRCRLVLRRMREEGFINPQQYEAALQFSFKFRENEKEKKFAPYFVEYIRQELQNKYGVPGLYKDGLQVYTTLDLKLQKDARSALRWGLEALDKRQGFRPVSPDMEEPDLPIEKIQEAIKESEPVYRKLPGRVKAVFDDKVLVDVLGHRGEIPLENMKWTKVKRPGEILKAGDRVFVLIEKYPTAKESPLILSLEQEPAVQGALVALDPKTGFIRALVGGYDFSKSQYNRAVQARRQPGSAFKPFIYTAALRQGKTLADIIIDSPITYKDEIQSKGWKPENYYGKFNGPTTIRKALEHSSNVVTVKLLDKVGIDSTINLARKMGITSPLANDLSLALGSSGVSLLDMTSAYGTFANQGVFTPPIAVKYILNDKGEVLEKQEPSPERVLDEQTNYLITSLLLGVVQHGTGWRARRLGRPLAGKTGTTNDDIDAWFIGFSPDLVAGVWVGFDEYKSLGEQETGSKAACPIWVKFMGKALANKPIKNFPVPAGIVFEAIDSDTGLLATKDCQRITLEAFLAGTEPDQLCNAHRIATNRFLSIDSQTPEKISILSPIREFSPD